MRTGNVLAVCLIAVTAAPAAMGQFGGSTGGSSMGMSSTGGMGLGGSSGSSGMFGSRSLGSGISGLGSFGSSSGMSSTSMNGFGGSSFMAQTNGFVGTTAASAQSMQQQIGGSQAGTYRNGQYGGTNSRYGMSGMSGMNGMQSLRGMGGMNYGGMGGYGASSMAAPLVRTTKQVAFEYALPANAQLSTTLAHRLNSAASIKVQGSVRATVQGQTVILQGTVRSPHDRQVAEQLALLEPGIWEVRNELVVAQPAAGKSGSPQSLQNPPLPLPGPQLTSPRRSD